MTTHWDTALPPPLRELHELEFDYAGGQGIDFEPYSTFLSARETCDWFRAWTGNKEVDGSEFRIFGQDGTGGYAAFWLVEPSRNVLEQPIVFLGSEGETGLVATNFQEYLWLLAGGIGPCEAVVNPGLAREPNRQFTDFAKEHSSTGPLQPEEVVAKAVSTYPTFAERVESLCQ
jgi:hypothetical protein